MRATAQQPSGRRWRRSLRTPPSRADHALPPGAAARRQLHRPHRASTGARLPSSSGRVRRLPSECGILAHGFLRASVRRVRPTTSCWRSAASGVGSAPHARCAEDVADGGAPGRPRHPARAGAAMGAVAADPAARAAGRTAGTGHAGAAGGAARDYAPPAGRCRAQGRRRPRRGGHADPTLRLGGQPQHTIFTACCWMGCTGVVRMACRSSSKWVRPPTTTCMRYLQTIIARLMKMLTRRGVLVGTLGQTTWPSRMPTAGRALLRPLGRSHHLPHRLGPARRAEGADPARRDAALWSGPPAAVRRHRRDSCTRSVRVRSATASGWSSCAVTSPGRRFLTNACSSTPRAGGAEAQDTVARRNHAPGDEPAGVHAAACGAGSPAAAASHRFHGVLAPNAKTAASGGAAKGRVEAPPRLQPPPSVVRDCPGRAAPHRLGAVSQAGLRHRHGFLPELPRGELKIIAAILGDR